MSDETFNRTLDWIRQERAYQQQKFDYTTEADHDAEHWLNAFGSYEQRIQLFPLDTPQGAQAALKLAATTIALCEHILAKVEPPAPGQPSGYLQPWNP